MSFNYRFEMLSGGPDYSPASSSDRKARARIPVREFRGSGIAPDSSRETPARRSLMCPNPETRKRAIKGAEVGGERHITRIPDVFNPYRNVTQYRDAFHVRELYNAAPRHHSLHHVAQSGDHDDYGGKSRYPPPAHSLFRRVRCNDVTVL